MRKQEENSKDVTQDRLEAEVFRKQPEVLEYFADSKGEVQYNDQCAHCKKECKQSYRAVIKYCPRFVKAEE